jgi:hypothetical protein
LFVSFLFIKFESTNELKDMRLTVHVKDAKKDTITKRTKNGDVTKKRTINTLSYNGVSQEDVGAILSDIESQELGIPYKHYLSNEGITGMSRKKKSK